MDNRHIIMGTAGHIDHGKTTLIQALTGKETDYIKEEKERGISIDIGFAPLKLADDRIIGVIDVPGHEKFIKNMLAGIGGIDFVLLIIDVNEGIMPQTTEHFHIIDMLGIETGIIVLTKVDLAEPDWVDYVKEEIREQFADTIFAKSPIVPVSSITGQGIDELRNEITLIADLVKTKETVAAFRLPVDRIFSIAGFGTVVTGTALSGSIRIGEKVELLPNSAEGRIRGIQHHGQKVDTGFAGQRLAINISGMDADLIERGMVITEAGIFQPTDLIDVRIQMINPSPRELANRSRIRVYTGSTEVFGRVILLEHDVLESGQTGFAQIKLESPIVVEPKDRMIIRFYSPMETIAGATVIEAHPPKYYKRFKETVINELKVKEKGGLADRIIDNLRNVGVANIKQLTTELKVQNAEIIEHEIAKLVAANSVHFLQELNLYILRAELQYLLNTTHNLMEAYYKKHKYTRFVPKGQLHSEIAAITKKQAFKPKVLETIWGEPIFSETIESSGDSLAFINYQVKLTDDEQKLANKLTDIFMQAQMTPPSVKDVVVELSVKNEQQLQAILMYLVEQKLLVMVTEELFYHQQVIDQIMLQLQKLSATKEKFTASDFRDQINVSRKFAIALLEYFDGERITKRIGDERVLMKK